VHKLNRRPGAYSISINFRTTSEGSFWTNITQSLNEGWPIGFLVRETLESESDFGRAVSILANSKLIAPCYICISGTKNGVLLTRNTKSDENRWILAEHGPIIQTNVDHCMKKDDPNSFDVMNSYKRRKIANKSISTLANVEASTLWHVMSIPPIFNSITIYGTYMCPTTGDLETRLPTKHHGFVPTDHLYEPLPTNFIQIPENETHNSTALRYVHVNIKTCKNCQKLYNPHKNVSGKCKHRVGWHASFGDCSFIVCGFGLKNNIGTQHWGCCFGVDPHNLICPKSGVHEEQ